jgi:hypothetical protein
MASGAFIHADFNAMKTLRSIAGYEDVNDAA